MTDKAGASLTNPAAGTLAGIGAALTGGGSASQTRQERLAELGSKLDRVLSKSDTSLAVSESNKLAIEQSLKTKFRLRSDDAFSDWFLCVLTAYIVHGTSPETAWSEIEIVDMSGARIDMVKVDSEIRQRTQNFPRKFLGHYESEVRDIVASSQKVRGALLPKLSRLPQGTDPIFAVDFIGRSTSSTLTPRDRRLYDQARAAILSNRKVDMMGVDDTQAMAIHEETRKFKGGSHNQDDY